jgi:ATP-dependent DNA helicase PIF1
MDSPKYNLQPSIESAEQPSVTSWDVDVGIVESVTPPCQFLTGSAGTGKTYLVREKIANDPDYGILCSTTGISAINLGAITINAALGYYDTASLRDLFLTGQLTTRLHKLALQYRNLVIDEISMMDAQQLDYIFEALKQVNGFKDVAEPMGIIAVGDFAQLAPIKAPWAFQAECWPEFDKNTERLTKMWRQGQAEFLMALNAARRGDGVEAARLLTEAGVEWHTSLEMEFDGTTVVPKNDQVDNYNWEALRRVPGTKIVVRAQRWGKQRSDWKLIPETVEFKVGAYVMLLSNKMEEGELVYANGDCGHVRGYEHGVFEVELVRNSEIVEVSSIARSNDSKDRPDGWYGDEDELVASEYWPRPHVKGSRREKRYVQGQVKYYPMRLAYASTVHKSQGLSLDKIQLDVRNAFFGSSAMAYTALSRCRTIEGLRIVGMKDIFSRRVKCDPRITRWL